MNTDFRNRNKVLLTRVENGWIMANTDSMISASQFLVFESTESLAEQLVDVLGKSGWKMISVPQKEHPMPKRGPGGKFLPKNVEPIEKTA